MNEFKKMKNDPCWDNYKMVGTKKKNGKTVPNCVPEENQIDEAVGTKVSHPSHGTGKIVKWDRSAGTVTVSYGMGDYGRRTVTHDRHDVKKLAKNFPKSWGKATQSSVSEERKGLWHNIHAKRKRGERPAKPGEKGYPKTLDIDEAGPFSYGAKKPRKGTVAYNAMMKRKEQEKNSKLIEPKDQMIGNARVKTQKKDMAEARGEDSKGHYRSTESGAGMTKKGVEAHRRANPGSKLQTAVTGKVKPGSKDANRRKSFCARMSGMKGPMKDEKGRPTRKAMSLRRWRC